jgi:hypothetical protein
MHVYESEARLLFMRERADQLADEMRVARSAARGGKARLRLWRMLVQGASPLRRLASIAGRTSARTTSRRPAGAMASPEPRRRLRARPRPLP